MEEWIEFRYTLCFLTRADQVLMLHRNKPPNRNLWNGVGGHLEPGEDPLTGVLREVREETGYSLAAARFAGLMIWEGYETPPGGLYIFTAPAPDGEPSPCSEGALAWKPREWVVSSPEVVSNIHLFGPPVLAGAQPQLYQFFYQEGGLAAHAVRSMWEITGWDRHVLDGSPQPG